MLLFAVLQTSFVYRSFRHRMDNILLVEKLLLSKHMSANKKSSGQKSRIPVTAAGNLYRKQIDIENY